MRLSFRNGLFPALTLLAFVPAGLFGQIYYSTLVGTVRDSTGAVIPSAEVTATEISTSIKKTVLTNETGDYRMATLRPGVYRIEAVAKGFKTSVASDVKLFVAQTSRVDHLLEVGSIGESVTVTGAAPLVQSESAERASIMGGREVEALPLVSRNVMELTFLVPGVTPSPSPSWGPSEPLGNVNGNTEFSNQMKVDGGFMTNQLNASPIERINIDTVEEFKVETGNHTADTGIHAGGIVTIASKHGTNGLHGSAFEFLRNDKLSARSFFAPGKPPLRYNDFGATIGGPIIKSKVFFFYSYEGIRERRAQTFSTQVPTLAERQGDFTPGTGAKNAVIYDPFTFDPNTNLRSPFANNKVPQDRWNAITRKYLDFWPQPNTTGIPNFLYNGAGQNDYNRHSGRLDYNISSRDNVFGRFGYQSNPTVSPGATPSLGNSGVGDRFNGRDLVVAWDHMISPTDMNEARFSFANGYVNDNQAGVAGRNIPKELGLPFADNLSSIESGCPAISFGVRFTTVGACTYNLVRNYPSRSYYFSDDYSFRRGSHNFKAGFLTLRYLDDSIAGRPGGGGLTFAGSYTSQMLDTSGNTGQPFADFLLGYQGSLGYELAFLDAHDRRNIYQMYFQDNWNVNSKLTLQLGLRYDINLPPYSANGRSIAWIDGLEKRTGQVYVFPANAKEPLQTSLAGHDLGFPYRFSDNNWLANPHWRNFGPRFGVAFRPFGNANTVIRGGFGMYYDIENMGIQQNGGTGRPFIGSSSTTPRDTVFEVPPYKVGDTPPPPRTWYLPGDLMAVGYFSDPRSITDARSDQWNVAFQRAIKGNWSVEAAYVGNRFLNAKNAYNWNRTYMVGYNFRYDDGSTYTIQEGPYQQREVLLQRKKYPNLSGGYVGVPTGRGNYHAGQFQVVKSMSRGLQFRLGYTRSRSTGVEGQAIYNSSVIQDEWNQDKLNFYRKSDVPNSFFGTFVWQMPGQE